MKYNIIEIDMINNTSHEYEAEGDMVDFAQQTMVEIGKVLKPSIVMNDGIGTFIVNTIVVSCEDLNKKFVINLSN